MCVGWVGVGVGGLGGGWGGGGWWRVLVSDANHRSRANLLSQFFGVCVCVCVCVCVRSVCVVCVSVCFSI